MLGNIDTRERTFLNISVMYIYIYCTCGSYIYMYCLYIRQYRPKEYIYNRNLF